jgi:phage gp29-like protein
MREEGISNAQAFLSKSWQQWLRVEDELERMTDCEIYDKMRHDPAVKSAFALKVGAVLGSDWQIVPAVKDTEEGYQDAKMQADFICYCLEEMNGSMPDTMEEVVNDALARGIGICEKVYQVLNTGEFANKIGFWTVKSKDPRTFELMLDEFNNLVDLRIRLNGVTQSVTMSKFPILTHNGRYGSPIGYSDLRAAYRYYWAKQHAFEWWLVFAERFGMPTAKGIAQQGASKEQKEELAAVLDSIHQETSIVIEEGQQVELLTANQVAGGNGYESMEDFCDRQIAKAIIGNTLVTDQGTKGTGSYAQSKVHMDVLLIFVKKLRKKLQDWFFEQFIKPLIDMNFPNPLYPKLDMGDVDTKDIATLATAMETLINSGIVWEGESWIRGWIGIPEPSSDDMAAREKDKEEDAARQKAIQDAIRKNAFPATQSEEKYEEED